MVAIYKKIFTILINFLKLIKKSVYIIIIVVLIGFNILTLTSATVYSVVQGLLSSLPVISPLFDNSILNKNKSLNNKLDALTKDNANIKKNVEKTTKKMQGRIARLTATNSILDTQNINFKKNIKRKENRIRRLENKNTNIKKSISSITQSMQRRVATAATANVGAMPLEAIPFVGIGVIVASTGYEIYEACQMMKDLHKINVEINPYNAIDESDKVCGLKMPSINDLKRAISW
jgi:uncharacterized protein YoxC